MILESKDVKLVPFSEPWSMEYLWTLIQSYRYNTVSDKETFERIQERSKILWLGYEKTGSLGGVIYLCHHLETGWWTLDAYRDDRTLAKLKEKKDWSYQAGELVCKYFFSLGICDSLYTMHDKRNKLATRMCERLGFQKERDVFFDGRNYTLLLKRKE